MFILYMNMKKQNPQMYVHSMLNAWREKNLHNSNNQLTFSVQHLGDIQVFLSHLEGVVQIGHRVVLNQSQFQVTETLIRPSLLV